MNKYLILIKQPACYPTVLGYMNEFERDTIYERYKKAGKYYDATSGIDKDFSSIYRANVCK